MSMAILLAALALTGAGAGLHVHHYTLDLSVQPDTGTVSGKVAIRFEQGRAVHRLPVDMAHTLQVMSVRLDGAPATFVRRGDMLAISLPQTTQAETVHEAVIDYEGRPDPHALRFDTVDGKPAIASYGMPRSAMQWWPNLDNLSMKADSADIDITVPKGLVAASNGVLVGERTLPDGRHEFRWHEASPVYSDVISVAIGPYVVTRGLYTSITGKSMPLAYYLYKADQSKARHEFAIVPDVLRTYEKLFGPYPFLDEKYGIAEFAIPSFREHQTLPSLGRGLIVGTAPVWDLGNVANVIAHDLAHQWFGNSLTLRTWSDVWLNEGFATYAVALWREKHDGEAAYRTFMQGLDAASFPGTVYIHDDTSTGNLLTPTTFNKGAWVLHMLRHVMGDKAFFAALHAYVKANTDGLVDTATWIAACEHAYGKPLDWFFAEWIHGSGRPALHLTWKQVAGPAGSRLRLSIDQTQSGQVFTAPLDVLVNTSTGSTTRTVWLRHRHDAFELPVTGTTQAVVLDPGDWLLKR